MDDIGKEIGGNLKSTRGTLHIGEGFVCTINLPGPAIDKAREWQFFTSGKGAY